MSTTRHFAFGLFLTAALASTALAQTHSVYVPMEDGTRLAVDVYLPPGGGDEQPSPALLELTRYWRASESARDGRPNPALNQLDRLFLDSGYALVKVDVRGTGASFGSRSMEYGPEEVRDGYDLCEWVATQPWCEGSLGAYGTSYSGTTAELLCAVEHPALKAVIPGWSDFDLYRSPARPYGLMAQIIRDWGRMTGSLDRNDASALGAQVRAVQGDSDGALRATAVEEHIGNMVVAEAVDAGLFRDQPIGDGVAGYAEASPLFWKDAIEESGVPMLVLASWLDSGTAEGALQRLRHFTNPQKVIILASSHGGIFHASPFTVGRSPEPPVPAVGEQFGWRLDFLDHYLRGVDNGVDSWPAVQYFNLGEEAYRSADAWPVPGVRAQRLYLGADSELTSEQPNSEGASDAYDVDFEVSTGRANRWSTQMGGPVLGLDDRGAMDERMLVYDSAPLTADLQLSGTPVVHLWVESDRVDGAFLVYLEDVGPDGRSRYITEGGLRALHRTLAENPYFDEDEPFHSFAEADAMPLEPGVPTLLSFRLWPTSVLLRAGHRIRIAIAGADAGNLERVPEDGAVSIRLYRDTARPSSLDLPVVDPQEDE